MSAPKDHEKIIRLATSSPEDRELTLYLKGFMGRGESSDHFEPWMRGHRELVERRGWGPRAYGYRWRAGSIDTIPVPAAATIALAWNLYSKAAKRRRIATYGAVGLLAADEIVQLLGRFVAQYMVANQAARVRAEILADRLASLRGRYDRMRVVAHSLGCLHVVEAVALLAPEERPDEVHLLAPACRERDVSEKLAGGLARESAYLYHCRSDAVLEVGFRLASRGRALGAVGPRGIYPGLDVVDVGSHFGFWVHREYKNRFPELLRDASDDEIDVVPYRGDRR